MTSTNLDPPVFLLELAADDDAAALRRALLADPAAADTPHPWYCLGPRGVPRAPLLRTPLMVAATYGSLSALAALLSLPGVDPSRRAPSPDASTALHCAASGGATTAPSAVRLLLAAGADPLAADSAGRLPRDVIAVPPNQPDLKSALHSLLGGAVQPACPSSPTAQPPAPERREYPADPSLPDIKTGAYASDEFRMYSFKVRPCSRAYSHDWTECPFAHPGENARRRDPRKYHYSCAPCPEFRKGGAGGGGCGRGDLCEYAHGVFESWLHPMQYRTRLCKDGAACARRVCFFAHAAEELRPVIAPVGHDVVGLPTPPLSPSGWGLQSGPPNVPALHLPGSGNGGIYLSRLRTSLTARDMFDELNASPVASAGGSLRLAHSKVLPMANLDDLFTAETHAAALLSPRYAAEHRGGSGAVFSPTHKTAVLNQFQHHKSLLSPINTASFRSQSGWMSPQQGATPTGTASAPLSSRLLAALAQRERAQRETLQSLSSNDLGAGAALLVGSPVSSHWPKWGSSSGEPDWGLDGEELGRLRRSSSFELRSGSDGEDEPDLSWVNSLVKEPASDKSGATADHVPSGSRPAPAPSSSVHGGSGEVFGRQGQISHHDDNGGDTAALGAWLDQLQLDQMLI